MKSCEHFMVHFEEYNAALSLRLFFVHIMIDKLPTISV